MATSTALSSLASALSSTASAMASSHTMASPTMSPTPSSTSNPNAGGGNGGGGGGGSGKPLLFFVALGFGVVFTNLWIIVGVKYCFRYNQRHRQQVDQETGEPIDLANMPRPRRRREKKLLTMDEVNERFPLTKYKTWRATRQEEGLPAAGGVTAPPSRAGSIKETILERTSTEQDGASFAGASHNAESTHLPPPDPSSQIKDFARAHNPPIEQTQVPPTSIDEKRMSNEKHKTEATTITVEPTNPSASTPNAAEDDEDPISTAVPQELLQHPGDACAICIDNLDDDDEVRGLTCGHAFHAGCLDPWLTSRRACCPLCKADYYIPKPRAQNADGTEADSRRTDVVQAPTNTWMGRPAAVPMRGRVVFAGARFHVDTHERYGFPVLVRDTAQRHQRDRQAQMGFASPQREQLRAGENTRSEDATAQNHQQRQGIGARTVSMFRSIPEHLRPRHEDRNNATARPSDGDTTPGQLEAGRTDP